MKMDFKKAARKFAKASTLTLALGTGMMGFGAAATYEYYTTPDIREAYKTCVTEKKTCTPEQMTLAEQEILLSRKVTSDIMLGCLWLTMGFGYRRDERNKEQLKEAREGHRLYSDQYFQELGRRLELGEKLERAEAELAPYLADEKRKADTAAEAAAKQQLNQMAQDATTLQGQIKVGKKISIKPTPPSQP